MPKITFRDDQWRKIYLFLKNHPRVYAGKEESCRLFVEAVIWMVKNEARWRCLPDKYGHWNSVYKRFANWCDHGIWDEMQLYFSNDSEMENALFDSKVLRARP